ncbi:MAG: nucleotide exchange factor GrpE [Candidatus Shapirobacteria bacterium]
MKKTTKIDPQIADLQDKLNRSLADYANFQKRVEREKEAFASLTLVSIILRFLEVVDDYLLVGSHLKDTGLDMANKKFMTTLQNYGLTEINAEGQKFDPHLMECQVVVEGEDDKVMFVVKKGYMFNGQCLRPATVAVGKKDLNKESVKN